MYGVGAYGVSPFGFVIAFPVNTLSVPVHKIPILKVTAQDINVNCVSSVNNGPDIECVKVGSIGILDVMSPD
jgi:hypothetical protein